jgi:hypothetical protein
VRSPRSGFHLRPTDLTPHAYPPQRPTDTCQSGTACASTLQDAEPLAHLAAQAGTSLRTACEALGLTAKRTRPYNPANQRQGRRVWPPADSVYIKTLVNEWTYGMSFQSSEERNHLLGRYLAIYNGHRCHMALAGRTPFQQLGLLRATG